MDWPEAKRALAEARGKAIAARVLLDTAGTSPADAISPLADGFGLLKELLRRLPAPAAPIPRAAGLLPWLWRIDREDPGRTAGEHGDGMARALRALRDGEPVDATRRALLAETAVLGRAVSAARLACLFRIGSPARRRLWAAVQTGAALGLVAAFALLAAGLWVFATYPGVSQGLTGFYWRHPTESGGAMERIDHGINFSWGSGAPFASFPGDNFSARWEGCVVVDEGDTAVLEAGGDDAIRVVVDGKTVIDDWGSHGFRIRKAKQVLRPGMHPIRVTYQERAGYARVYLGWSSNGGPGVPVPPENLLPRTVVAQSGASDTGCPKMPAPKK